MSLVVRTPGPRVEGVPRPESPFGSVFLSWSHSRYPDRVRPNSCVTPVSGLRDGEAVRVYTSLVLFHSAGPEVHWRDEFCYSSSGRRGGSGPSLQTLLSPVPNETIHAVVVVAEFLPRFQGSVPGSHSGSVLPSVVRPHPWDLRGRPPLGFGVRERSHFTPGDEVDYEVGTSQTPR